jgi:hypothetical protein
VARSLDVPSRRGLSCRELAAAERTPKVQEAERVELVPLLRRHHDAANNLTTISLHHQLRLQWMMEFMMKFFQCTGHDLRLQDMDDLRCRDGPRHTSLLQQGWVGRAGCGAAAA